MISKYFHVPFSVLYASCPLSCRHVYISNSELEGGQRREEKRREQIENSTFDHCWGHDFKIFNYLVKYSVPSREVLVLGVSLE
jgi:hypothetical protein